VEVVADRLTALLPALASSVAMAAMALPVAVVVVVAAVSLVGWLASVV
jgi:hypothetical protein